MNTIDGTPLIDTDGDNILIYVSQPAPLSHSLVFSFPEKGILPRPHATFPPSHRIDSPILSAYFYPPAI